MKLNDLYPDGNYCLLKIGWDEGLKPYKFRWVLIHGRAETNFVN